MTRERITIPLHQLPVAGETVVRVEYIQPTEGPVLNSVHRHSYHEIFLFRKGSGVHMIDLQQVDLVPPCLHLVAPGQVHKLDRSADLEGMVVLFDPHFDHPSINDPRIRSLLRPGTCPPHIPLTSTAIDEAFHWAGAIEAEGSADRHFASEIQANLLSVFLLKCLQWSDAACPRSDLAEPDPVERFVALADEKFLEWKRVQQYASELAISPGYLNELVKRKFGRNASQVLNDRLVLEAKRLLLHSDLTVKEVSYTLQMQDPAYFTRMFRMTTPVEYREKVRKKYKH